MKENHHTDDTCSITNQVKATERKQERKEKEIMRNPERKKVNHVKATEKRKKEANGQMTSHSVKRNLL
jgi:hypothetical protein